MMSPSILVIGATRGLGAALVKQYAGQASATVFATTRSDAGPDGFPEGIEWLTGVDLMKSSVGDTLVDKLKAKTKSPLDVVIINAGRFMLEDFSAEKGPSWDDQVTMYTTSSIAPTIIVHRLTHAGLLQQGGGLTGTVGAKIILVSSEAGSIELRHEKEGGGNYGHHASKAAVNMAGKLLSIDLKDRGVIVSIIHPGFMRTEMTKGVGFDKHWDEGGAVTPDEAAKSLMEWTENLTMEKSGEYWAPRGPRDIGMAETVLGNNLGTPLHLPW